MLELLQKLNTYDVEMTFKNECLPGEMRVQFRKFEKGVPYNHAYVFRLDDIHNVNVTLETILNAKFEQFLKDYKVFTEGQS